MIQNENIISSLNSQRKLSGQCPYTCHVTRDKSQQNQSSAIIFHLPNLHWERYRYPRYRDPEVPWILMTYESANSVRERTSNWGRYPALTARSDINNVFNRTLTLRHDSDIVALHGEVRRRHVPLTRDQLARVYSQETCRDFSNYTKGDNKLSFSCCISLTIHILCFRKLLIQESWQAGSSCLVCLPLS